MPRSHSRTMLNLRLQRRHYQFIADVIKAHRAGETPYGNLAYSFAEALQSTNPRFDVNRFVDACGPAYTPPVPTVKCLLCQSEAQS